MKNQQLKFTSFETIYKNSNNKRLLGFTLAEVLITIGIIGVVAAMTLPTLIQNHQKQVYVAEIKKGISTISNAFSKMQADENASTIATTSLFSDALCAVEGTWGSNGFTNENGCEERYGNPSVIQQIIPKYLQTVKTCIGEACNIQYKNSRLNCTNGKCKLSTYTDSSIIQQYLYFQFGTVTGFYTSDGMIYYIEPMENMILIGIDVNGEKGPNEWGRDLFAMHYNANDTHCYYDLWHLGAQYIEYLISNGWKMDY